MAGSTRPGLETAAFEPPKTAQDAAFHIFLRSPSARHCHRRGRTSFIVARGAGAAGHRRAIDRPWSSGSVDRRAGAIAFGDHIQRGRGRPLEGDPARCGWHGARCRCRIGRRLRRGTSDDVATPAVALSGDDLNRSGVKVTLAQFARWSSYHYRRHRRGDSHFGDHVGAGRSGGQCRATAACNFEPH